MRVVYKYPLKPGYQLTLLPAGAEILTARDQAGVIQLWVLVDDSELLVVEREFYVAQTGEPIDINNRSLKYISTVEAGWWIGHVFELLP